MNTTIATQTDCGVSDDGNGDFERFDESKLSVDKYCYECKVKYRDPTPKDLVMFLHAWAYTVIASIVGRYGYVITLCYLFQGPDWHHQTELPAWASENWVDEEASKASADKTA